jgi:hypothetical protein
MNSWKNDFLWTKGHVTWLKESQDYRCLTMVREDFNDTAQVQTWRNQGFTPRTGVMYDMRYVNQPPLTQKLISYVEDQGLEHIGVSYYRMDQGDNLPYHSDLYSKYISVFNLEQRKKDIVRFVFFPEDRQPGHILEIDGKLFDWRGGDWVAWKYDTPHLAANLGSAPRYTIQVTGVLREDIK